MQPTFYVLIKYHLNLITTHVYMLMQLSLLYLFHLYTTIIYTIY